MFLQWWRERGRKIFHFHDGARKRSIDPLKVWAALQIDPQFEMERHTKELDSKNDRVAAEASVATASAVRGAFGVREFEDGGLTNEECILLLQSFIDWLGAQKKSTS